jgi:hypothetical protein
VAVISSLLMMMMMMMRRRRRRRRREVGLLHCSQFVTLCFDLFFFPRRYNRVNKIGANITALNSIRLTGFLSSGVSCL